MSDRKLFKVVGKEESPAKQLDNDHRKRVFGRAYKIAFAVIIVAACLVAYFIYERTKVYESYLIASSVQRTDSEDMNLLNFNGNIMSFSKDGAGATDTSGKLLWNQTFTMQNPMMSVCGQVAAFADYGGSLIYIQNENGETGTINTDMPIRKICVSSGGYVVAVLEDAPVTWVYMYDFRGTIIATFRTTMEKSGYPVDLDISPSGELVGISYYRLDCNDEKSSVAFYNFGEVGKNNIDNYVSGYNYQNSLIPVIRFLNDETAVAVSDERIIFFSGAHKPVSTSDMFTTGEICSVFTDEKAVAVIYSNESEGSKYRLEMHDLTGKKLFSKDFDFDYSNIEFGNDTFVLYGDSSLFIGTYSGDLKYEGFYEKPVLLVVPTMSAQKYCFVTADTLDMVEFK